MTNPAQNPDVTETQKTRTPHMLSILVDLSHPTLSGGDFQAKLNLVEVLKGCAKGVMIGSEAITMGAAENGSDPIGVFLITEDKDGEGKGRMKAAIAHVRELAKQTDKYAVAHL